MRALPRRLATASWIVLPILFGLTLVAFYPFRFVFEFDTDEGINLMKALLHLRGYSLYSEIYSDQPPLFTYFLSFLFRLVEPNVTLARLGVVGFSLLLLSSAMLYLIRTWGTLHAIFGFFLIALLPDFPRLSVSVMIGLPSIALALAALAAFAHWEQSRKPTLLVLSALLMSMAVLTKAIVAPLGILLGLGILLHGVSGGELKESLPRSLGPALLWGGISGGILVVAALFIGSDQWVQLTSSHVSAADVAEFVERAERININRYVGGAWAVLAMGTLGTAWAIKKERYSGVILATWSISEYVLLANTIPVWYHHQLAVTVPAAILAAIPLGEVSTELVTRIQDRNTFTVPSITLFVALGLMLWSQFFRVQAMIPHLEFDFPNLRRDTSRPSTEFIVLAEMHEQKNESEFLVTDNAMFAFRLGKPVPPNIAVFSGKRFHSGLLTEQDLISAIIETDPDQVLLARHELPAVEAYLNQDYNLRNKSHGIRFYIRNPQ